MGFGRDATTLAAFAVMSVAVLLSAPGAVADTPGSSTFREWITYQTIALYRLDRAQSRWTVRQDWFEAQGCGLRGTFVFRRIDTLKGRSPASIAVRLRTIDDSCPTWFEDPRDPPTGRWIVVGAEDVPTWWHLSTGGRIDTIGEGEGGPDSVPATLAGWYRALGLPETSTAEPVAAGPGTMPSPSPLLMLAAASGVVLGLRRHGRGRQRATGPVRWLAPNGGTASIGAPAALSDSE